VFVEDVRQLPQQLRSVLRANDVLVTLGAGSIGAVAAQLPTTLAAGGGG
jgi:UDP-N-acetylmuramate--alanine ligase